MTTQYRPLSLIGELQRELSNLFLNDSIANFDTEQWAPAVDIVDETNQYLIKQTYLVSVPRISVYALKMVSSQ